MFPLPKYVVVICSIGHALLFSLSLVGGARIISNLLGTPITTETANSIFGVAALVTMPLAGYFNIARFMLPAVAQRAA